MHYPIIVIIIIIVTIIIIILIIIIIIIIIIIAATIQELPLLPAAYCSCVAIILAILLFQGRYYLIHRVATCLLEDIYINYDDISDCQKQPQVHRARATYINVYGYIYSMNNSQHAI